METWWRSEIEEGAFRSAELEVFQPGKAALASLEAELLAPEVLPELWEGESVAVSRVLDYFAGGRTVTVPREGYDEVLSIPACSPEIVEGAVAEAVRRGLVWLRNGPASFQGEELPAGVLTASASLRRPLSDLPVDRFGPEALPGVWKDGRANLVAVMAALEAAEGHPLPWEVLRRGVENAVRAGWLALAPESGPWPCEVSAAQSVVLSAPSVRPEEPTSPGRAAESLGPFATSADALQDLTEALPALVRAAAGTDLEFQVGLKLGKDGKPAPPETVEAVTKVLSGLHPDFAEKK